MTKMEGGESRKKRNKKHKVKIEVVKQAVGINKKTRRVVMKTGWQQKLGKTTHPRGSLVRGKRIGKGEAKGFWRKRRVLNGYNAKGTRNSPEKIQEGDHINGQKTQGFGKRGLRKTGARSWNERKKVRRGKKKTERQKEALGTWVGKDFEKKKKVTENGNRDQGERPRRENGEFGKL